MRIEPPTHTFCIACYAENSITSARCSQCGLVGGPTDFPAPQGVEASVLLAYFLMLDDLGEDSESCWEQVRHKIDGRETWSSVAAIEVTTRFVNAEMDFTTEGQRGLGRTTTFTPRLAGWKRKDIQRLSNNQKEQLYLFISQLVCAGYGVFLPFLRDQRDVQHVPVEELYRDWITSIYVTGEAVLPPDVRGHIANARPHFVSVFKHQYESILGLKVGMLSKAKFETIASYYFIAGICLASSEQSIAANLMADAL